ncbi:SPOR domain-containing protein [Marinilabiliaceae bacterium ANBcel2]|nr:SPOR domain-containing protein [Marinilabiliaceae bacterium ANBcel2]
MNLNLRNFLALGIVIALLSSCASMRKGSSRFASSEDIYVQESETKAAADSDDNGVTVAVEEDSERDVAREVTVADEPAVVVREERVTPVEVEEKDDRFFQYYVIVGSFRVLDNARNFRDSLFEKGFTAVILESDIGFYRVSVGAFDQELRARDEISNIRGNYSEYSDVWLLINME